jgi:hypothetical protein
VRLTRYVRLGLVALAAMSATGIARGAPISSLTFLSSTQVPTGTSYGGALVFGLSGIDYDAAANRFISQRDNYLAGSGNGGNPVAFTLQPVFETGRPGYTVRIDGVNTLGGANGLSSLESIRYDPAGNGLWLASEGPNTIYHIASDGSRTQVTLPANVAGRTPPGASNYGLEGLTFAPGGGVWVSREDPMSGDAAGVIRISNVGADGSLLRQYAYTLDTVVARNRGGAVIANPPGGGVGNNGVSEILAVTDTQFLVMERGFDGVSAATSPQGVSHNYIRIYAVDLSRGSDVSAIENLVGSTGYEPLPKTLLFDSQSAAIADALNTYDTKVDNLEGMSFGPTLANGDRSLILVSDNNNSGSQRKTQFLVFDVGAATAVPEPASGALMIAGLAAAIAAGARRDGRARSALAQSAT